MRIVVPKRGEKRGLLDLAARNAQVAYQTRFNENVAAHYDALETLRVVLNLPSIPRRIECFDISTIQGSETVASMVVCEDGRMKRVRVPQVQDPRPRVRGRRPSRHRSTGHRILGLGSPDRAILDDFASMHEVVLRRYRKVLEHGGPFPDLILIDGGKGQLSSAYAGARGARAGEPGGGRHRQEGRAAVHARARGADRAGHRQSGAAAHPADPRRGAPVRDHVPPRSRARSATCARSSTTSPASGRGGARRCSRRSAASPACAAPRARI